MKKKIFDKKSIVNIIYEQKEKGKTIVFTNGCFDLLHPGHIHLLTSAQALGDFLIVGLNSDSSVGSLKPGRPIMNEQDRSLMMASLECVSAVVLFNEETPLQLINVIKPDILVKGSDYQEQEVVGGNEVKSTGGRVVLIKLLEGYSTSSLIKKIISSEKSTH